MKYMPTETRKRILLSGDIDHHHASAMRQNIDAVLCEERPSALELDFSGVTFMDSSGIGLIMGRYRLLNSWGGKLIVTHIPPHIEKLMHLAGLGCLPIFEETVKEGMSYETNQ
ncbi:MAG: STAS domain-containing protein [Clostridia bacterium]|nr:STAS domain-containing protein [Clostridia bacterium]